MRVSLCISIKRRLIECDCFVFHISGKTKVIFHVRSTVIYLATISLVYFHVIVMLGAAPFDRRPNNPMINLEKLDILLYV